jgi:Glycosyl hydrolase family 47
LQPLSEAAQLSTYVRLLVTRVLLLLRAVQGLLPKTMDRSSLDFPTWGSSYSMGAMADSYYEYLLKIWIMMGQDDVGAAPPFRPVWHAE